MDKPYVCISTGKLSVSTVSAVVSISDKEAVLQLSEGRLTVYGEGITATKIEVEQGVAEFSFTAISSLSFGAKKKFSLRNIFK